VTSRDEKRSVPFTVLKQLLRVDEVTGIQKPFSDDVVADSSTAAPSEMAVLADGEAMGDLAPHLTYELAYIWNLAPGAAAPQRVDLVAYGHTWRESNIEPDVFQWFDPTPVARGTVTVEQGKPS